MANSIHEQYLEAEVLGASPVKLVEMLCRGAVEAVGAARRHLHNGSIQERSRSITKAAEILNQLMLSLDHARGGEISRNLVELYAYMQTRLIEANTRQIDPPLAEVERLLNLLWEAWRALPAAHVPPADPSGDAPYIPLSCVS